MKEFKGYAIAVVLAAVGTVAGLLIYHKFLASKVRKKGGAGETKTEAATA